MNNEIWKPVVGFGNRYEVSNFGRVKSHIGNEKMLSQYLCNGYPKVSLSKDGESKHYLVHRLVAQAFIPNPHSYTIVNHKDENPSNNNVNNLEWCTFEYNYNYGTGQDRQKKTNLEKFGKKVKCIENGVVYPSIHECARALDCHHISVSNVVRGKQKHTHGFHFILI